MGSSVAAEELKSASKYGYDIKVLWGFNFERNPNLFTDYVNYFKLLSNFIRS
jgi:hypothetical protein